MAFPVLCLGSERVREDSDDLSLEVLVVFPTGLEHVDQIVYAYGPGDGQTAFVVDFHEQRLRAHLAFEKLKNQGIDLGDFFLLLVLLVVGGLHRTDQFQQGPNLAHGLHRSLHSAPLRPLFHPVLFHHRDLASGFSEQGQDEVLELHIA